MKTTRKDFEAFKAEFLRWQKLLGLMDWRVRFHHEPLDKDTAACITPDIESRITGVYLGFVCDHPVEEAARHEALELLVSDLADVAKQRYVRPDDVVENRHAIIRRLENLFDNCEAFKC